MQKIKTYAGFAKKMGKVSIGETAYNDIKSGKAIVLLLEPSAAVNTLEKYQNICENTRTPFQMVPDIGEAIGKPNAKTVCIKDRGLGNKIIELMSGRENDSWQN